MCYKQETSWPNRPARFPIFTTNRSSNSGLNHLFGYNCYKISMGNRYEYVGGTNGTKNNECGEQSRDHPSARSVGPFEKVSAIMYSNDGLGHIAFPAKSTKIFFVPSYDSLNE